MVSQRNTGISEPSADIRQSEDAAHVLRQFRQVLNTVKTHFQQVEKKSGLGGAQVWALSIVQQRPGVGVNDLSRAMDIHQSTASNLVKALIAKSLVEVRREGADRRSVQLYLLPEGARALRKAPGPFAGVLPGALLALDAPTLRRLKKDLAQLIVVLDADEKGAGIPLGDM
jgi:DNA-binding MarR family transcriptional regulator